MKVITRKNLPTKLPFWLTVVTYMALDMYNAPPALWAGVGVFFTVYWIGVLMAIWQEDETDTFL